MQGTHPTVFMITHDVDDAILLADKILLMSNGPRARIAELVEITLPRDRTRQSMHHDTQYYRIRNHVIDFLVRRAGDATVPGTEGELPQCVRPGLEPAAAASTPAPEMGTVLPLPLERDVRPAAKAPNT